MSTVVGQLNGVRTVLNGLSLGGVIPLGLLLTVPSIPSALSPFSCS
jgi:predicted alpha/beta superfamily hydrolase